VLNKLSITYNGTSITLENVTTVAVIGDNGIGKTALLERVALVNEDNTSAILNVKGSVSYEDFSVGIDDEEVKCERVEANRVRVSYRVEPNGVPVPLISEVRRYNCQGNIKHKVMIVYPYAFKTPVHEPHYNVFIKPNNEDVEFNRIIKRLIEELIDGTVIHTVGDFIYEEGDNTKYLDSLGRGISNTVKLIWTVFHHKPDILLIDDIETLGLHPKRLQTLLRWFKEYIREDKLKAVLFTTNSDAYADLAEVDEEAKFLLLRKDGYIIMDREEVLKRLDYEDLRYTAIKDEVL